VSLIEIVHMPSTLILIHGTTHEEKTVEVLNFYPPAWLVLRWGELAGIFLVDLRKGGIIQKIKSWRIKDLRQAQQIYKDFTAIRKDSLQKSTIHPDDLAAVQHWKDKGLL
jgi:hypothetical protein